ncbi:MAG: ester cyclase [Halocynthiibacter sp.]
MASPDILRALIAPLQSAMADFERGPVLDALTAFMAPDAVVHLCHPFGDLSGPSALYDTAYAPLLKAFPDLERRDWIISAGTDTDGNDWIGCAGHYVGTFTAPFLDIPPTGHFAHMRFHEFYRISDGMAVEMQAIWDVPELMMQANAWPMAPSLGREMYISGPASQDGLHFSGRTDAQSTQSLDTVIGMLTHLSRHPAEGGPEIMQAEKYWDPRVNWYGPAGIGTARGLAGFRNWHQIPFLNALPDRKGGTTGSLDCHFYGDGTYVVATGWPNMQMTVTGDGWLGIAPSGQEITMRSLDFWRVENALIRENWVLVDLLDVYAQLGVDVFARLREFNKARVLEPIGANL